MIKFFRKIRQDLLSDGKTGRYMKYAIGEIILVVLSILIALSINNWNQRKSNETKITNLLKEIQIDILSDLEASNMIFDYQLYTDSVSEKIINNKYTPQDVISGKFQPIGYNYRDFITVSNGFDNLSNNLDNVPEQYKHLIPEIKNLYVTLKAIIDVYNDKIRSTVYNNIDSQFQFDWSQEALKDIQNNGKIEYFLNDKSYKNLVALYMLYRYNIFQISNEYRVKAIDLYLNIHEATNSDESIPEIVNYKNISSNDYAGSYKLKESVNPDGRWDSIIKVIERDDKLVITFSDNDSELNLLSYNKSTFFLNKFYNVIIAFDRQKEGQLYISDSVNSFAKYEKTDSN